MLVLATLLAVDAEKQAAAALKIGPKERASARLGLRPYSGRARL